MDFQAIPTLFNSPTPTYPAAILRPVPKRPVKRSVDSSFQSPLPAPKRMDLTLTAAELNQLYEAQRLAMVDVECKNHHLTRDQLTVLHSEGKYKWLQCHKNYWYTWNCETKRLFLLPQAEEHPVDALCRPERKFLKRTAKKHKIDLCDLFIIDCMNDSKLVIDRATANLYAWDYHKLTPIAAAEETPFKG